MVKKALRGFWATCVFATLASGTAIFAANNNALPAGWSAQDVGVTGLAGSATYSNSGVFTVRGAGADIWGSADSFQFVWQTMTGDGQIVARVNSLQNSNTSAKAGIMLRETLAAGSTHVMLDVRPNGSVEFMSRPSTGGSTSIITGATVSVPVWLKLVRVGTAVTAYVSLGGNAWVTVGSTTVSMGSTIDAGLAVTSHTTSSLTMSKFENVAVTGITATSPAPSLPSPWTNQDVGSTGIAGSTSAANGTFTVAGAGADIWGTADAFQYVLSPLNADGQVVARIVSETNTDTYAKAGVMFRETTAAGAADVILDVRPGGSLEFMSRPSTGGATAFIAGGTQAFPVWLKLVRTGITVTASTSGDGQNWTDVGSTSLPITGAITAGLAVTSHTTSALNTSTFDNVAVTPAPSVIAAAPSDPPPSGPTSPSPAANATGVSTSTSLSWTASGATSYDLSFGTTNPPQQVATGLAAASYTPSSMTAGTKYYWQVVARNAAGTTVGPVWSFTTQIAPPAAPGTPSPSSGATGTATSVALAWSAAGATNYDLNLGTTNPPPQVATGLAGASYAASAMKAGTTYYWQVIARNAGGTTAGSVWSFTTQVAPPAAPGTPSPANGATGIGTGATLSWTAAGATSYDILFGSSNPPSQVATGLSPAYTPSGMAAGTTYYWQVIARNAGGTTTGPVWSFSTQAGAPGAPSLPSPPIGATGVATNATLSWIATGATSYDISFGTSNPPPQVATGVVAASYTPSGMTTGKTYYWQVVAKNTGGGTYASTTGPVWSFSTQAGAPGAPSSPSPTNGATGVATSATLSWSAAGATSYDVNFGTSNPPPSIATGVTSSSFSASNLAAGSTYFWQITARSAGGTTPGPMWTFTTASVTGTTWVVKAGGDLQGAINSAKAGDTITLEAGATFTGNFVLPNKSGSSYVTIRSSAVDAVLPAANARINPSYASQLPKIRSANTVQAMSTAPGAHHYRLMFLEFLSNYQGYGDILDLGDASGAQTTLASVPHDLVVDRVYIHGDVTYGQKRGIGLNSAATSIVNSYISEIKFNGQDSQAIAGWNGPGPFTVSNNYLEAASENLLFGGADPSIPNLVPSDITITRNYLAKQLIWKSQSQWNVKNLLELKNAQRVVIDGNVMEYNWVAAQAGSSIVFTPRNQDGTAPWSVVQYVQFTNNVVRHVSSGINILGNDNEHTSLMTNHITIRNNLFEDLNATTYGGDGRFVLISGGDSIAIDHNTVFETGSTVLYAYDTPTTNFAFTNNIVPDNAYAIMGGNASPGNGTIKMYFPSGVFLDGVYVAAPAYAYPTGNYYPSSMSGVGFVDLANQNYRLGSTSNYRAAATDGTDIGCNIDALNAAAGTSY